LIDLPRRLVIAYRQARVRSARRQKIGEDTGLRTGIFVAAASLAIALGAGRALAEVAPGDVKIKDGAFAKSLTGKPGDAKAGKKWFVGRKLGNCLACHQNKDTPKQQFHGEVGPALDGVAGRYNEAQLRAVVINSKQALNELTLMPAFYKDSGFHRVRKKFEGKTILSAQQVEDVVAYLLTLKE
jgi:sulfur-oxidizing protein SoxX